ncbi:MAG: hypothetical protein R3F14_47835, partial [Polyangiaceae bacterium]
MKRIQRLFSAGLTGVCGLFLLGGCDLVAGIGVYCVIDKDPGCGAGGAGGIGGAGGTTTEGGSAGTTSSIQTGGGGSGGAEECEPVGAMEACYTGAAGTEGVGACKGGMRTCQASGTWGACDGEVVPVAETCLSTEDEDCDGSECALWSAIFGDAALQRPLDMAIDPGGNVLLLGTFQGDMQVDSTLLSSKGSNDLFLIKLTPTGTVAWARSFGDG